ncbi:MAG: hypothetical protein F6K50_44360 [Moorea sp. SIO3I7]|nr:hypothetical protein [Moorena sp. SIO3I7]
MKISAILQARMNSARLPGKILAPLVEFPVLNIIHKRIKHAQVNSLCLATSSTIEDNLTEYWGHSLGLEVYRGDIEDVLSRFTTIIRKEQPDWVVRLTADNPFVDAEIINKLIDIARVAPRSVGYIYSGENKTYPLGYVPEIVRSECLLKAESEIPHQEFYHRTHVTSWVQKNTDVATLEVSPHWKDRSHWRWTIDTHEDYQMARKAFDLFGEKWSSISYEEMVNILDSHPEVTEINRHVKQKRL